MANYAVITKVIVHNKDVSGADTVEGSYAKKISDYLESVADAKQFVLYIRLNRMV